MLQVKKRTAKRLKPLQVERAKAKDKPYKLADGESLYLYIAPSGAKSWQYRYSFAGRPLLLTIGTFPDISLSRAREHLQTARTLVANGTKPSPELLGLRKAKAPDAGTFKAIAEAWYALLAADRSHSWKDNARRWLDQRVYPVFGSKPIEEVKPADVLEVLKSMERDGVSRSAEYLRQMVSQIFDYAIKNLRCEFNPAQPLRGAVVQPPKVFHPHVPERELPAFLSKVDAITDSSMRLAVNLLLHTAVRRGELIEARWTELDLDRREWRIPQERMKNGREHVVPLSAQAVYCFEQLKTLAGGSEYVFPSPVNPRKPAGGDSLLTAFEKMNCGVTPHGMRSTFSTIANERSGFSGDVIEAVLAHVEGNRVRASYNRASLLESRAKLLQWWSDYLENARSNVVTLPRRA